MAITSIIEVGKGRSGSASPSGNEYARKFLARTNDPTDDFADVHAAFPSWFSAASGTPHPNDTASFALRLTGQCISFDCKLWSLDLPYGPDPEREGVQNPLLWPAIYEWDYSQSFTGYTSRDINGDPIYINSTEEDLDVVEYTIPAAGLTITKNISSYNPNMPMYYREKVNSDVFLTAPRRCVLCRDFAISKPQYHETYGVYYTATVNLAFNPFTWDYIRLNAGLRYKPTAESEETVPFLKGGIPVTDKQLLAQNGTKLSEGAPPIVLRDEVKYKVPFNVLYWT